MDLKTQHKTARNCVFARQTFASPSFRNVIMSSTTNIASQNGAAAQGGYQQATEQLLQTAEDYHTKPLWVQMNRLNPPLPNPKCQPHVWRYEKIRPSLLQAGELVTDKQAERRVLMLVNPTRGIKPAPSYPSNTDVSCRGALHHRHNLRWASAGNAQRNRTGSSPHCVCLPLYYRG